MSFRIDLPVTPRHRSRWPFLAIVPSMALLATAACSDSTSTSTNPGAYITAQNIPSSGLWTGPVEDSLPDSLEVLVTDANNTPVSGVTVTWTASTFGGIPSTSTTVTNANGFAKVLWTLGAQADTDTMTASISTNIGTAKAIFVVAATPLAPSVISLAPGFTQSVTGATGTLIPLAVKVVDQYDNPVPGATVTWALAGAGTLSNHTTSTDVTGDAATNWTLGAGSATVTASVAVAGGGTQTYTFGGTGS